jgi:hypothetical protein
MKRLEYVKEKKKLRRQKEDERGERRREGEREDKRIILLRKLYLSKFANKLAVTLSASI